MKFGKQIQRRQLDLPEYGACFVNYKALKKLIKHLYATPELIAKDAVDGSVVREAGVPGLPIDSQSAKRAKEAFFFRLQREIEKVNTFYLQKEAEFVLRLQTLLDKKRTVETRLSAHLNASSILVSLVEGLQQFDSDLNKLQQFVEINQTAISKILKKWDKASKSRMKELYLQRAVDEQPCFNRDVLRDLSDKATTARLELEAWAEGENVRYDVERVPERVVPGQPIGTDENDTDVQILHAATNGNITALNEWIHRLVSSPNAGDRFTRTFLAAINDSSDQVLEILLSTNSIDVHAEDDINGRNCLHEAAIAGKTFVLEEALRRGVDVSRLDVYGRMPLHYACMHGRVAMVSKLLQDAPATVNLMDHDNFTPLIHSIIKKELDCVKVLLEHKARIDPQSESEHAPLNLACQHGTVDTVKFLLQQGAKLLPDAEGLYPQHLVARSTQPAQLLLVLNEHGADLNQRDKLYQWTPLFHAASEGRVDCLKTLLGKGVEVDIEDEKGLSAIYYAAWEGHLECMSLLRSRSQAMAAEAPSGPPPLHQISLGPTPKDISTNSDFMSLDIDGIPDLSLPPPIIPLRRYGHNFLDNKTFIQIYFDEPGSDPIHFYHSGRYPAARLSISSKMSDLIPRNVMLPIQDDSRNISFQIDDLDQFTIEFDIYPTFGSKVIAKTVVLSDVFKATDSSSGRCCLPLFDPRLRAVGQIRFGYQVIKPYSGSPLDITQFATYWIATSALDHHNASLVTGSSLSGDYVKLFVQVTRDRVPVLCPWYTVTFHGVCIPIGRLTYQELQHIRQSSQPSPADQILQGLQKATANDIPYIYKTLATSFLSLKDVLANLAIGIHVNIAVLCPTAAEEVDLGLGAAYNINNFADSILTAVFDQARALKEKNKDSMRSIVFTSYNTNICTALNWKQPNYPVLLCNDLGAVRDPSASEGKIGVQMSSLTTMSIKESARIAQANNFMGIVCHSSLLDLTKSLTESIKELGLVVVADMSDESESEANERLHTKFNPATGTFGFQGMPEGVNGIMHGNGVLRFNESIEA